MNTTTTPATSGFRIVGLAATDFKRLEAVEIHPVTGKPIVLTGDNGQGKSSILDSVLWALQGGGSEMPVRKGAEKATVTLQMSNGSQSFTISRRENEKGNNYLDVKNDEGLIVPKAQTFLNGLIGNLSFDPEEFARLGTTAPGMRKQADMLRQISGLDTRDLDARRKQLFDTRTEANRTKDEAQTMLDQTPLVTGEPLARKSASELIGKRDTLLKEIDEFEQSEQLLDDEKKKLQTWIDRVMELERQLAAAKEQVTTMEATVQEWSGRVGVRRAAVAGHDAALVEVNRSLSSLEEDNAKVDAHNRNLELREQRAKMLHAATARTTELSGKIAEVDEAKAKMIAEAKMPLEGLTIDDDGVKVNGIPFYDLNTAERIKLSTAVAMAQNPELRIIFVREGALLSRANLQIIADMAEAQGYQLWVEIFSEEPREGSLHIVEGAVSTPPAAAAEQTALGI
jgi:DNA repair exonuclease SbcCD ATPase subunit